jgi:hypothetical protein
MQASKSIHAPSDEVILTTCPRDCYDACGVAVVKRDGGFATSVETAAIRSAAAGCA